MQCNGFPWGQQNILNIICVMSLNRLFTLLSPQLYLLVANNPVTVNYITLYVSVSESFS